GVAEMGDLRALGRVGWKTLAYTVIVSSIAVVIGVTLVNLFKPGAGIDPDIAARLLGDASERASAIVSGVASQREGLDLLLKIVPDIVVRAATENDLLAVMFFALMLGIGIVMADTPSSRRLKETIEGLFEVAMR